MQTLFLVMVSAYLVGALVALSGGKGNLGRGLVALAAVVGAGAGFALGASVILSGAPFALSMNLGTPPTPLKARTGL